MSRSFFCVSSSTRRVRFTSQEPVSGFGYLLIVLDSCEGAAMARSILSRVFTFREPGFEGGIVGDEAIEQADTKRH
jgi:hypothetical protein